MTTTPAATERIRPRDRDAILSSLKSGVVPATGQQHFQVGRHAELTALLKDIERIADGGAGTRFVIGEFGSGKTFFLNLVRSVALQKKLVTVNADLSPDRRLHATGGQARSLYTELMKNMATRAKPEGGAMGSVVERFVTTALTEARDSDRTPDAVIRERLDKLTAMTGGYDFAEVIAKYWTGHDNGDEQLKADAVRWLRGEFSTRTDARTALGVRTIIDDANFYDHLKLLAQFVRLAGFDGLLVCLDEMVNLYKLANSQARNSNYEQILRILNDSLQGSAQGIGFLLGGTPDFLTDARRGLYSYAALQSRLNENSFAVDGRVDLSGPVIRLSSLSPEDLYVLLQKLVHVHAGGNPDDYLVPHEALQAFMQHCAQRIGAAYFRTPRHTIRAFLDMLSVLEQNDDVTWPDLVARVEVPTETNPDLEPLEAPTEPESSPVAPAAVPSPPSAAERHPLSAADDDDDDVATFRL